MFDRLEDLLRRYEEIMNELNEPSVTANQDRFRSLMKEQSDLTPLVEAYKEYKKVKQDAEDSMIMLESESDEEMRELLKEENSEAKRRIQELEQEMKDFYRSGPEESRHINRWLADNCFGDIYTRSGLNYGQREMITFCFLAAQGGCEPQLISHAAANMKIGNDKQFLIRVISQCLPYIGYPRSLNALRCVDKASGNINDG